MSRVRFVVAPAVVVALVTIHGVSAQESNRADEAPTLEIGALNGVERLLAPGVAVSDLPIASLSAFASLRPIVSLRTLNLRRRRSLEISVAWSAGGDVVRFGVDRSLVLGVIRTAAGRWLRPEVGVAGDAVFDRGDPSQPQWSVRIPVSLAVFPFRSLALEAHADLAPVIGIYPATSARFETRIGVRYWLPMEGRR